MATKMETNVNVNEISRISGCTVVKGEIASKNDIRIDGFFEGKIYSEGRVVVGEKAFIKGDIICTNVDFWGTLEGNFYVKDTLFLKNSAKVKGELHVKRLQVDLDSMVDGSCHMVNEAEFEKMLANDPTVQTLKEAARMSQPAAAPAAQAPVQPMRK